MENKDSDNIINQRNAKLVKRVKVNSVNFAFTKLMLEGVFKLATLYVDFGQESIKNEVNTHSKYFFELSERINSMNIAEGISFLRKEKVEFEKKIIQTNIERHFVISKEFKAIIWKFHSFRPHLIAKN